MTPGTGRAWALPAVAPNRGRAMIIGAPAESAAAAGVIGGGGKKRLRTASPDDNRHEILANSETCDRKNDISQQNSHHVVRSGDI